MKTSNSLLIVMAGLIIVALIIAVPATIWVITQSNQSPQVIIPTTAPLPTETVRLIDTLMASEVPLVTVTLAPSSTPLPTNTPIPSFTPLPTLTPFPSASGTLILPTSSSGGSSGSGSNTGSTPTATATTVPCNRAELVSVSINPTTNLFPPLAAFTQTWQVKNTGTCNWTTSYDLIFKSGTAMTKKNTEVAFTKSVKPGEKINLSVKLKTPEDAGTYSSDWLLRAADGKTFGLGSKADQALKVQVTVLNVNPNTAYNFILDTCAATWRNSRNQELVCPGTSTTDTKGFVTWLLNPKMENRKENEPALWVHPDERENGSITGIYPPRTIQSGEHLLTWVGCLADTKGCNVTFEIKYRVNNGDPQNLGTWVEQFDGSITQIDLDLSSLAGQSVKFVFKVTVNNFKFEKAQAFWFVPRIELVGQ